MEVIKKIIFIIYLYIRVIKKIIFIICLVWIGFIGYQYFNKTETAKMLLDMEINELSYVDFDILLQKMEKGYEFKKIELNEKDYWMGWVIVRPGSLPGFSAFHIGKPHAEVRRKIATTTKEINEVKVYVYVDYISIVPFGYLKTGFSHILTRKLTN